MSISALGWELELETAQPGRVIAVADAGNAGAPGRGVLVALADGAMAASLLEGFAEAYLACAGTLGNAAAAERALAVMNSWLLAQRFCASMLVMMFDGPHMKLAQIGAGAVKRTRNGCCDGIGARNERRLGVDAALVVPVSQWWLEAGDELQAMMPDVEARIWVRAVPNADARGQAESLARLAIGPEPKIGEHWDGYRLERLIYRGPCTLLMLARGGDGARVVLKLPRKGILEDRVFRDGFIREAWVGANTRGGHVARYLPPRGETQSCLYLTLPFYQGETLETLLAEPVALSEALGLFGQLCEAVESLARQGILHCDLKPENIIVETGGNLRLLDFGLAFLPGRDGPTHNRLGGTTMYMAPELFGHIAPSARTEVYALGVILFRMLSGGKFPGRKPAMQLARLRADLPAWVGDCVAVALAEPERRPESAEALLGMISDAARFGSLEIAGKNEAAALKRWRVAAIVMGTIAMVLAGILWGR